MTDVPMFPAPPDARREQACDGCLTGVWDSDNGLRVKGWLVFDGSSLTGQPLHVRRCPPCQRLTPQGSAATAEEPTLF